MSEHTNPQFSDILSLLDNLPKMPEDAAFEGQEKAPIARLQEWLIHASRIYDYSRGFDVNRCALYWAGYDHADGFDGQAFVTSCQDGRGSLRSMASILDTDLQIFELDPQNTTAKTADELAMACSYGMMAIEESTQMFCTTSFGQGVETAAQKALDALNKTESFDLETFMTAHCGLDHAALLGNAIAAVMKGIPLIIEGTQGQLIKTILLRYTEQNFANIICTDHIISNDLPGHQMIGTAIMLKTFYAGSLKTSCGKVKSQAA